MGRGPTLPLARGVRNVAARAPRAPARARPAGPCAAPSGPHLAGHDRDDEQHGDQQRVVRDAVCDVDGALPDRVAEADDEQHPRGRADQIPQQERAQPHAGPADGRVDEHAGDRQQVGGRHGEPAPAPGHPLGPVHPPLRLRVRADEHLQRAMAPAPAGPPVQPVEHHRAGDAGQHGDEQRRLADARERAHGDHRGHRAAEQLEQQRMRADQRRDQRQEQEPVGPAERDQRHADHVGPLCLAVPREAVSAGRAHLSRVVSPGRAT